MILTLSCGCQRHPGGRKPCPELRRLMSIVRLSGAGEANLAALRDARLHMREG
jgi:hypothetical protein